MTEAIAIFYGPKINGYVLFTQKNKFTNVRIKLSGIGKNKKRAIHIHTYGDVRNGCSSLGGHWNPSNKNHGSLSDGKNHHYGDMINNIISDEKGNVDIQYNDPYITLKGKNHIFGRSVVIHSDIDDLGKGKNKESKITGNAGKRIAYGIIVQYNKNNTSM